ncbi:hypothetical protein AB0O28_14640 [Microbispora sp. NPDC088329]|uniref:hypothetical protein n=1 Tax=Microbispora sp. NPDC088329 TaxID=3154869 RepID=UPI00344612C5
MSGKVTGDRILVGAGRTMVPAAGAPAMRAQVHDAEKRQGGGTGRSGSAAPFP